MIRILFVDDEPKALDSLRSMLRAYRREWTMEFCEGPEQALALMAEAQFDVIVTDLQMPGMDGATLVKNILKDNPNISCIMVSQVSNSQMVGETYMAGIEFFIHKPINIIEVINIIKSVTEKINLKKQISMVQDIFQTSYKEKNSPIFNYTEQIQLTPSNLGILGEKGGYDRCSGFQNSSQD